jgi:type IV pilus assembly protein PilC
MRLYKYTAYNMDGKRFAGKQSATDEEAFREEMKEKALFLVECREIEKIVKKSERLLGKEVPEFSRNMGTLLTAGIPLAQTLEALRGENKNAKLRRMYDKLFQYVNEGVLFSEAMRIQTEVFPPLLVNMVAAAEETGKLGASMMQASEYYEKQYQLQSKVRSSLAYPVFLLALSVVIMMGIFTFIIPYFTDIVGGSAITGLTAVFMKISSVLRENILFISLGFVFLVALVISLVQKPPIRLKIDQGILSVPKIGDLFEVIYTARFSQTMAYLYMSDVSIVDALRNTKHAIGNTYVVSQFDHMINQVTSGLMLSEAILEVKGLQNSIKWPIKIGEESGDLANMLLSTSESLTAESERAADKLTSFLGPVMIIILGIFIGMIMISVFMPILNMYQGIGGEYNI